MLLSDDHHDGLAERGGRRSPLRLTARGIGEVRVWIHSSMKMRAEIAACWCAGMLLWPSIVEACFEGAHRAAFESKTIAAAADLIDAATCPLAYLSLGVILFDTESGAFYVGADAIAAPVEVGVRWVWGALCQDLASGDVEIFDLPADTSSALSALGAP